MDNTVVKSTEFNTLKPKVNKLDNKVSDSATYTYKSTQNLEKKIGDADLVRWFSDLVTILMT